MNNEVVQNIKYLKETKGLTVRQIATETGIPRKRVSRIYCGIWQDPKPRTFKLAPYRDLIAHWFGEIPSLKSLQIWQRLKERNVVVSRRCVDRFTACFRHRNKEKVFWPLVFLPGEEGQVDWFYLNHPVLGKMWGFTFILSYSRFAFAHLFQRSSFEFFIEGHLMAFDALGGCPRALRYDNLKSVVLKREPLTYNPSFLEFAGYHKFEIRLCNPRAGNEKGRVERLIRSIRDTFLNTASHHQSLYALNEGLHAWMHDKNNTIHRATDMKPVIKKKEETLKALPQKRWHNALVHPPKTPTKTGMIIFDTNLYSVPTYAAHTPVTVKSFVDRVEIYDEREHRVASHPRCFARKTEILNPVHRTASRLSDKAKRERIFAVIKGMAPEMEIFLEQNAKSNDDPYQSAYIIFQQLRTQSRGLLMSLVREAVQIKCCRINWVLSRLHCNNTGQEVVAPQNKTILVVDYQPRSLENYDVI